MSNRLIEKLSKLAPLTDDDREAIARATARDRHVAARQDLIREGDRPGPVFVILEGWACRYKIVPEGGRQILAFLMPGDCCDVDVAELSEMDHGIQTLTPAHIAMISRPDILALLSRPSVSHAFRLAQLIDEATLRAWIASMGRRTSIARVAHLMCELYIRARSIGLAPGDELELPLSQIVLADALGMTPVHINRVLRSLREQGIMEIRKGSLTIRDAVRLAATAGFDENYLHRRLRIAA